MPDIVLALTTVPHDFDAPALARSLVESGAAACVTMVPGVRSVYTWQGAVHDDREQQLIIKTTRERVQAAWAALKERHPYDVPEFVVIDVLDGNPDYLQWIADSVRA